MVLGLALSGAEPPAEDRGAAGLWRALKCLNSGVRVLYIVAHPDDEDAGTLTWLVRGQGAEVTLLSLTRGEAGANLITADSFDELGALRTLEHQRAAELYGVRLSYTPFADFGFSKNVAESWRKWDRKELLAAVQQVVDEVRPHIIMSRFSGTARDGHGHHQASGLLALQAFEKPNRWTPLKLYQGVGLAPAEGALGIDAGEYDPVLGRSYAQVGREGYRWHRSQAMGAVLARPGPSVTYYQRTRTRIPALGPEKSVFDGVSVANPAADSARRAMQAFSAQNPSQSAAHVAEGLRTIQAQRTADPSNPDLREWETRFQEALALALGLDLEALVEPDSPAAGMAALFRPAVTFRVAVANQTFNLTTAFFVRGSSEVNETGRRLVAPEGWLVTPLGQGRFTVRLPAEPQSTAVPWSRPTIRQPRYLGAPIALPPLVAEVEYEFHGARGRLHEFPQVSFVDTLGLQHREPVAVGPRIAVRFATPAGVSPLGQAAYPVQVIVRNVASQPSGGRVLLELPPGWTSEPPGATFAFSREGEEALLGWSVRPAGQAGEVLIRAVAETGGQTFGRSFERTSYPGLGSLYLSHPAEHRLQRMEVQVKPGITAGYVMGTGDEVPFTLRQLGVPVDMLGPQALAGADLSRYSVILLGIRAYAAREDVRIHNARLLDYVEHGGTLIVQYNTQEYDRNFGPYPYSMTARAEETSEEDSPVEILAPAHPVFRGPNPITPRDFEGWFEQRGSKFWTTWDKRYTPLVETHDAGQPPQKGVWLVADYGKGKYIYCSLAFYRQLPMAVPGAVRLFANLVSLGSR